LTEVCALQSVLAPKALEWVNVFNWIVSACSNGVHVQRYGVDVDGKSVVEFS